MTSIWTISRVVILDHLVKVFLNRFFFFSYCKVTIFVSGSRAGVWM